MRVSIENGLGQVAGDVELAQPARLNGRRRRHHDRRVPGVGEGRAAGGTPTRSTGRLRSSRTSAGNQPYRRPGRPRPRQMPPRPPGTPSMRGGGRGSTKAFVILEEQGHARVAPSWLRHLDPDVEVLLIGGPQGTSRTPEAWARRRAGSRTWAPSRDRRRRPADTLRGHQDLGSPREEPQLTVELPRQATIVRYLFPCPQDRPAPTKERGGSGGVGCLEPKPPSSAIRYPTPGSVTIRVPARSAGRRRCLRRTLLTWTYT